MPIKAAATIKRVNRVRQLAKDLVRRVEYFTCAHDYASPGLTPLPSLFRSCFPEVVRKPPSNPWVPHFLRVDRRVPSVGLLTWDEATILYNYGLHMKSHPALEIGSWIGWSTLVLALADTRLTVVDPLLGDTLQGVTCRAALHRAQVQERVELLGSSSPEAVRALGASGRRWSVFLVDGDHSNDAPLIDAQACADVAEPDAVMLFHDAIQENVTDALLWLQRHGWNCGVHFTAQFVGVAWRGAVTPIPHTPDPAVNWERFVPWRYPHLTRLPRLSEGLASRTPGVSA